MRTNTTYIINLLSSHYINEIKFNLILNLFRIHNKNPKF